ncbi:MAG: T9SS type A sorting domain-containing protein [Bacteroidales bacterium]|nr:T9SS type A sorting domain-containing protein [Bacteroidales bacterium]
MKIHLFLFSIFFFLLLKITTAQLAGCTDPLANNFNPSANQNDGSCTYNPVSISPLLSFNLANNLIETSGLIKWGNYIWTHNDSDDINLYALDSANGNLIQTYALNGKTNTDWEEISQDEDFVYVGDFGNNSNGNRTDLKIFRIDKSSILANSPKIETINFSYPNQTSFIPTGSNNTDFDCEAFIVSTDSIFLFTKQWISTKTSVYSMPKSPGTYVAKLKSTYDVQGLITGSTYLESKNLIALCGYTNSLQPFIYLFYDYNGTEFFGGNKRKIEIELPFHQVEGITSSNGLKYFISNEHFSEAQLIDIPQKLHILDLSDYLGDYLSHLYDFTGSKTIDNNILFPNPAADFIIIKTELSHLPTKYKIIDQDGNIAQIGELTTKNQVINISKLSSGVFIVQIGNEMQALKVIKK